MANDKEFESVFINRPRFQFFTNQGLFCTHGLHHLENTTGKSTQTLLIGNLGKTHVYRRSMENGSF